MNVTSTSNTPSLGAALSGTGSAADGEQRFLKLLVTQLGNQDPLNPLENAQLTSQLAQMSTVSGIEKLNAAMSSLVAQSASGQLLQSASLVGRSVQVSGQAGPQLVSSVLQGPAGVQLELQGGRRVGLADVQLLS